MAEEKQVEKRIYKIESPIFYKKKRCEDGAIEMERDLGDPLVKRKILSIPPEESGESSREEKIRLAILALDKENKDLWTGDGKPKTDAIGVIEGEGVSAGERDAAWAEIGEAGQ